MVQAYILIQTEVGKAASVAKAIAGISGVTMAEDVTGPYDVIARVEAPPSMTSAGSSSPSSRTCPASPARSRARSSTSEATAGQGGTPAHDGDGWRTPVKPRRRALVVAGLGGARPPPTWRTRPSRSPGLRGSRPVALDRR